MRFKKGHKINLGKKHSIETIKKLSEMRKGKHFSPKTEFKKGLIPWNKDKKGVMPIPWNKNKKGLQKAWNKGKKGYHIHTEESIKKLKLARAKQIITIEHKKNISIANKGKHSSPSTEFKKGHTQSNTGRTHFNKETRAKLILPTKDTSIELKIQNFLKLLNIEFFTHQYIKIEHGYQCDILIPSKNLVIECDGNYWHKYPVGKDVDHIRTKELLEQGFKVLRLWECEINDMDVIQFQKIIGGIK